jgi:uncharacterized protein
MNRVVHFEIHASDPDALETFYKELLGWEFQHMGMEYGEYRVIVTGPGPNEMVKGVPMKDLGINGGMTKRNGAAPTVGGPVTGFVNVIGVDNVDEIVDKALVLGGTVALPAMDIPNVGRVGYLLDPDNNIFGIIAPIMPTGA